MWYLVVFGTPPQLSYSNSKPLPFPFQAACFQSCEWTSLHDKLTSKRVISPTYDLCSTTQAILGSFPPVSYNMIYWPNFAMTSENMECKPLACCRFTQPEETPEGLDHYTLRWILCDVDGPGKAPVFLRSHGSTVIMFGWHTAVKLHLSTKDSGNVLLANKAMHGSVSLAFYEPQTICNKERWLRKELLWPSSVQWMLEFSWS